MPPKKDPLRSAEKMPLREGKLRLEKAISRGEELLANPSFTADQHRTWQTNAMRIIDQVYPDSGHIYTFIGTPQYSADLPFGVPHMLERQKELRREIDVLKAVLQQVEDDLAIETSPPQTSTPPDFWSDLHPDVVRVSRQRFSDGHYTDAVEAAFKELNSKIKTYVYRATAKELDGASLMYHTFSLDNPIARLADLSTEDGKNIQKGYMQIFAGAMTGIRNPKTHSNVTIDRSRAIHHLYLASLLHSVFDKRL